MTLVRRIARPLLASLFVVEGFDAIRHPGERAERSAPAVAKLNELTGLPNNPEMLVRVNGAIMVMAGLALAASKAPRAAAFTLAAVLIPTTYAGHAFWYAADPETRAKDRRSFIRNVSLLGGLVIAGVDTAGKPGLVWRRRNHVEQKAAVKAARAEVEESLRAKLAHD